jgi:hemerythrin
LTCQQIRWEYEQEAIRAGPIFRSLIFCSLTEAQNTAQLPSGATHVRLYINPEAAFKQREIDAIKEEKERLAQLIRWQSTSNWTISHIDSIDESWFNDEPTWQQEAQAHKLFQAVFAFIKEFVIKVTLCTSLKVLEVLEVHIDAPHNQSREEDAALKRAAYWLRGIFNSVFAYRCPKLTQIKVVVNRRNEVLLAKFGNYGPFAKETEFPALEEERQQHKSVITEIKARMAANKAAIMARAEAKMQVGMEDMTVAE